MHDQVNSSISSQVLIYLQTPLPDHSKTLPLYPGHQLGKSAYQTLLIQLTRIETKVHFRGPK